MRLLQALRRRPLDRPPIWLMRQAGRYLPEYRSLREHYSFQQAVRTPEIAAEITLQPLRRFPLDAAIVFQDIMTPLEAMGVEITFDPGPRMDPMSPAEVASLDPLQTERVDFVLETMRLVRAQLPDDVALIGFAGAPLTLLAYLTEGGGSKDFPRLRRWLHADAAGSREALRVLASSTRAFLRAQIETGANVVQLFDSWVGLLARDQVEALALPAARAALEEVGAPTVYFAPRIEHASDLLPAVGATCYGIDWRTPLGSAWAKIGLERSVQGNLDPAVLLTDASRVRAEARRVLEEAAGRPGHVFSLGHGMNSATPPENVAVLVETIVGHRSERGTATEPVG